MSLPNSYTEVLTRDMTLFGGRTFKEVIKLKLGQEGRSLTQYDWYPCKKRKRHQGWAQQIEGSPYEDTARS